MSDIRIPKDLRPLAKALKRHGWTLEVRGSGHIAWLDADGKVAHTSAATTNARGSSIRNSRADIIRAAAARGIDLRGSR